MPGRFGYGVGVAALQERRQLVTVRTVLFGGEQFGAGLLDLPAVRRVEGVVVVEFLAQEAFDEEGFGESIC